MMKKLNYYDVKSYASEADEKACEKCWNKEIELNVDEYGRVFNEEGQYIADVVLLEDGEDY